MAYLQSLNFAQRSAVEHGVVGKGANIAGPLLVIAGAGSGKTNTLAHRVAHLIVNGADPRRILLLTFSRRAAAEMERRAERIIKAAIGTNRRAAPASAGRARFTPSARGCCDSTPHAIGLDPAFTIHDREDSADLMNLVRHELRLFRARPAFPAEGDLPRHLLARRQCQRGAGRGAAESSSPGARNGKPSCGELFDGLRRGQAGAGRARLRRPAALLGRADEGARAGECRGAAAVRSCAGRRVPGHQRAAGRASCCGLKPDGAGLTVVGDDAQAIYGFRAANVRNILDFPGTSARRREW